MLRKIKIIINFLLSILLIIVKQPVNAPINGPINFAAEKRALLRMIEDTPANTDHAVFISGFVGTKMVERYLKNVAKGNFSVTIIRGYKQTGKTADESSIIETYNKKYSNKKATIITVNNLTHMKSYFWFDRQKKLIRALTGSGNFTKNALIEAPNYKEVLYDISNNKDVGLDLFCGGVQVTRQEQMVKPYSYNCHTFDRYKINSFHSSNDKILHLNKYAKILAATRNAEGLIILTGDAETSLIEEFLYDTKDRFNPAVGKNLDIYVGNNSAGLNIRAEVIFKNTSTSVFGTRVKIIREHSIKDAEAIRSGVINSKIAKTHTKLYVWYNSNFEIVKIFSGSSNFSTNGVQRLDPFREILIELNLNQDWKNDLVCKVIRRFNSPPSNRVKRFCNL